MKILIAAASFASNMSGLQRHALNAVRCLLPEPAISSVHLVIAPWQREFVQAAGFTSNEKLEIHTADMKRNSLSRNLWYFWGLPQLASHLDVDMVHLSYPMPVNAGAFRCPTMVTLHDMYPYEIPMNFGFPKFIFNRMVLQQCLRKVDAIACVSDITLFRLKQYASAAVWQKAVRIYNCVEAGPVSSASNSMSNGTDAPFLLCVAQHRRNKNIPLLIRTFNRILRTGQIAADMGLVIVGIAGPETRNIRRMVSALDLDGRVSLLEGVLESELQWCYRRCEALVAPSVTEGFGLPIAEALIVGCRIVCSDIPAFREVGDGQCRFVALGKNAEERLAASIVAALREPKRPPQVLQQFSASVLASQYTSFYRRLITSAIPMEHGKVAESADVAGSGGQPL